MFPKALKTSQTPLLGGLEHTHAHAHTYMHARTHTLSKIVLKFNVRSLVWHTSVIAALRKQRPEEGKSQVSSLDCILKGKKKKRSRLWLSGRVIPQNANTHKVLVSMPSTPLRENGDVQLPALPMGSRGSGIRSSRLPLAKQLEDSSCYTRLCFNTVKIKTG